MKWFKQHRMDWIAESLRVYGFINRVHIERKFGLSEPQASTDLRDFMAARPRQAIYDARAKCYRSMPDRDVRILCESCGDTNRVAGPDDARVVVATEADV